MVNEEAEKLGMNGRHVVSNWVARGMKKHGEIRGAGSLIMGYNPKADELVSPDRIDGKDIIGIKVLDLKDGWRATRRTVRHELYHLKKHLPLADNRLLRKVKWLYQEPAADVYALTGLQV